MIPRFAPFLLALLLLFTPVAHAQVTSPATSNIQLSVWPDDDATVVLVLADRKGGWLVEAAVDLTVTVTARTINDGTGVAVAGPSGTVCRALFIDWDNKQFASKVFKLGGKPVPPPNVPVANLSGSATDIFKGEAVNFFDMSEKGPTSWLWAFPGGTPSSSTEQNPTVTYNTPGTFDVSLTATNADGSDTETKANYITVADAPPVPEGAYGLTRLVYDNRTVMPADKSAVNGTDKQPGYTQNYREVAKALAAGEYLTIGTANEELLALNTTSREAVGQTREEWLPFFRALQVRLYEINQPTPLNEQELSEAYSAVADGLQLIK